MSEVNNCFVLQQDDEKKNKKKQSPVDDRPVVPAPSEAMLNSEYLISIFFISETLIPLITLFFLTFVCSHKIYCITDYFIIWIVTYYGATF